jgi:hypothetical protein
MNKKPDLVKLNQLGEGSKGKIKTSQIVPTLPVPI